MPVSRRSFLVYAGAGAYSMLRSPELSKAVGMRQRPKPANPKGWKPIKPSSADEFKIADGFSYEVLLKMDDALGSRGPYGEERFGCNADFTAYFPIDALSGGRNNDEGLLFVNHEYPLGQFVSHWDLKSIKTGEQIMLEKHCVGASIVHIKRENGKWKHVPGGKFTRRLTALYPKVAFSGAAAPHLGQADGTLANCSGGRTPWYTALSCEENFHLYNTEYAWGDVPSLAIDEKKYGWVLEVDPFNQLPSVKHSALGRFAHENTAWRLGTKGHLVIYMGDDTEDQYLYKFVTANPYRESMSRKEKSQLLSMGTLYAADFIAGKWLPIDLVRSPRLKDFYSDQGEALIHTRAAAKVLGATPIDRPEDCEVHPLDGSLYVSLTNSLSHGDIYGQIVRLIEDKDDAEAETFRFEIFLAGGPQSGLACPDNLAFDSKGNLWVVCDVSGSKLNKGAYKPFGNNGLHYVPTSGPAAGEAFQLASAPIDAEFAGPWWSEKEDTLFLSVQHPGEYTLDYLKPTSRWPNYGNDIPRSSVVAITGFKP